MSVQFKPNPEDEVRYDSYALGYKLNIRQKLSKNQKERLEDMKTLDQMFAEMGEP